MRYTVNMIAMIYQYAKRGIAKRLLAAMFAAALLLGGCVSRPSGSMPAQTVSAQATPPHSAAAPLTPEPVSLAKQNPLVASGETVWRYLDEGSPPASWNSSDCDDSGWKTMAGSLGAKYGELQEIGKILPQNLLNQYRDGGETNIPAYYFRAEFSLENAAAARCIQAQIEYDDAVTIYINGQWAFEANILPEGYGEKEYGALDTLGVPNRETLYILDAGLLREGRNVLCVELRQASANSSDVYFDFISLAVLDEIPQAALAQNVADCLLLQLGARPGNLRVTWTSDRLNKAQRLFWEEASALKNGAFSENCRALAPEIRYYKEEDIFSYSVDIENVKPGADYAYGVAEAPAAAARRYAAPDYGESFEFLFAGDPQIREKDLDENAAQWERTLSLALARVPGAEFIISGGDQVNLYESRAEYMGFAAPEQLRAMPVAMVKGNHDTGGQFYEAHFARPDFYWFEYGEALFVALDSNSKDYEEHEAFLAQARAAYLAQNAREEKWLIVLMHHAIYGVGNHSESESTLERREAFTKIFAKNDVDLVLMGHDHSYARSFLMDGQTPDIQPPPYGEAYKKPGQTLYITGGSASGSKYYPLTEENRSFAAALSAEETPQIIGLSVDAERIRVSAYRVEEELRLFDEFSLYKE